jgi:FkbM family methyltransferase
LLRKNITANNLKGEIIPINAGIGAKNGSIIIETTYASSSGDNLKSFKKGRAVPIFSLDSLLKNYDINDAVLKMDCEGGEYRSVLNSPKKTLRKFSQIQLEYHYGYKTLAKYLTECGFRVTHTMPKYSPASRALHDEYYCGYLFAERMGSKSRNINW